VNELFAKSLKEKNTSFIGDFPDELMNESEAEIAEFILEYTRKHRAVPSKKRLMAEFETFLPFKFESTLWEEEEPPLSDIFEQTIQRKLIDLTSSKMREANRVILHDGRVPLEIFNEIQKIHTMSLGVVKYSKFDRELYFRRSVLNIPFKLINSHLGGLSNGDFLLIVGRLGTGKSTVAQHIAKTIWLEGKKILFVSAEMLSLDVFSRIDAMVGRFNPLELRKGKTDEISGVLGSVLRKVKTEKGEIIIPRSRLLSPSQIAAFAKNLDVDLIIVDGAYLLKPSDGKYTSKWEKVATVSNELKQIALDLDLPLIATAQIKRGATTDEDYTPEDIALSDALGQDSDFVLAIKQNKVMKEKAELQLIKNRYGSLCTTLIRIDFDTMELIDESFAGGVSMEAAEDWKEWGASIKKKRGLK
jgi:replicative DNA helicase